jgi:hypothetical protein
MPNGLLETVKQQTQALTAAEKLDLAEYLVKQAELDRAPARAAEQAAEPDPHRRREYAWLREHRDEYAGQYVALNGDRLVAHSTDLGELHQLVREAGAHRPFFVRVESRDELPFGGW